MEKDDFFVYVLVFIFVLIVFAFAYFTFAGNGHTEAKYQTAVAAENPMDICKTPNGYSDADWKQHMSHHPDRYRQCLKISNY